MHNGHESRTRTGQGDARFLVQVLASAGVVLDNVGELRAGRRILGAESAWFLSIHK